MEVGERGGTVLLRHCGTSRNVTSSILGGVTEILHFPNASCRTMALGLTELPGE